MSMRKHTKTLLVINAEGVLEKPLVRDVRERGAQGWTVTEVHGASLEGVREGAWEADRTIEMKVICDETVAEQLAQHVLATYAPHYAVTMFTTDVGVFRPQKF